MSQVEKIYVRFKRKLNNKVKIASDKTETKENFFYFTRKDMGPVHNKAGNNSTIKNKKSKFEKFAYFFNNNYFQSNENH